MDVRRGYKQTEVGVIPEDWEVAPVGKAFEICNNLRMPISQAVREKMVGTFPYYGPTSIQGYINEYRVEGEFALIGEDGDHFLKWQEQPMTQLVRGRFNVNNHAHLIRGVKNVTAWFYYYFAHRDLTPHLTRQGAGRFKLTKSTLTNIPCAAPPTKAEQEAIAEALSDADALIESLEQLLAKKRQIKQGAMQELLAGKKRLPGFRGEWEAKCIAELADCLDNLRVPINDAHRIRMRGDYPYCGANGVLDYIDRYCIDDSVILIAEDGGHFDEHMTRPIAYQMTGKFLVNNHAHILKAKPNFDQDFLFYSLVHKNILSFLASGTRAKLNKSELNKIIVRQPTAKAEQTAIATVLSDMAAEITALEAKLSKARQLKQGMMQELLTGRIRLI